MHALVGADTLNSLQAEDAEDAGLHPGSCPVRMSVQEIGTSSDLLSVQIAAPQVAFPRDVIDGLDRGKRCTHRRADEQHRLLFIEEGLSLDPLRLDAEVVRLSSLIVNGNVQGQSRL